MPKRALAPAIAALLSLTAVIASAAATVELDASFGEGGFAVARSERCDEAGFFPHTDDDAIEVLVDDGDQAVVVGSGGCDFLRDVVVARFTSTGSPDETFGDEGVTRLDIGEQEYIEDAIGDDPASSMAVTRVLFR